MSLIVVEGVDASGKSTLLENARIQIPKRYFVIIRHSCRPLALHHATQFMRAANFTSYHAGLDVIADRHPLISEPIYGSLLRGGHLFEESQQFKKEEDRLDELFRAVERVIYCRPSDDTIIANVDNKPQLAGVKEKILDLLDSYDQTMVKIRASGVPVYLYDYTTETRPLADIFFGGINT